MIAHRRYITIKDPKQVVLSDLPFQPGQRVEVVLIAEEDRPGSRLHELREMFRVTQALPQAQVLSEDEIAAEIAAYRMGR